MPNGVSFDQSIDEIIRQGRRRQLPPSAIRHAERRPPPRSAVAPPRQIGRAIARHYLSAQTPDYPLDNFNNNTRFCWGQLTARGEFIERYRLATFDLIGETNRRRLRTVTSRFREVTPRVAIREVPPRVALSYREWRESSWGEGSWGESCSLEKNGIIKRLLPECLWKDSNSLIVCSICLEEYIIGVPVRRLPCMHVFHSECLDRWLETSGLCPLCKTDIKDVLKQSVLWQGAIAFQRPRPQRQL